MSFGLVGMLVGRSLARNLWLIGAIASGGLAAYLAREEEGGALSDAVRLVGYTAAVKARQLLLMYRTGRLSYETLRRWEALDKKWELTKKFEAAKQFGLQKEKEYEIGSRLGSFLKASINGAVRGVEKLAKAKDRTELIQKLPVSIARPLP